MVRSVIYILPDAEALVKRESQNALYFFKEISFYKILWNINESTT